MKNLLFLIPFCFLVSSCGEQTYHDNSETSYLQIEEDPSLEDPINSYNGAEINEIELNNLINDLREDELIMEIISTHVDYMNNGPLSESSRLEYYQKLDDLESQIDATLYDLSSNSFLLAINTIIMDDFDVAYIDFFDSDDDCCAEALRLYQHCNDQAQFTFTASTYGFVIIAIIGVAVATAGAGPAGAYASTVNLYGWATLATAAAGVQLVTDLTKCNWDYQFNKAVCPCQCEFTITSPC